MALHSRHVRLSVSQYVYLPLHFMQRFAAETSNLVGRSRVLGQQMIPVNIKVGRSMVNRVFSNVAERAHKCIIS